MSFVLEDQTSPSAGQSGVVVAPGASTLGRSSILSSSAGSNALADFATDTPTATATATPEPEPTETPVPPTETPVPPTETPAPIVQALADEPEPEPPTATPEPPTPEPPTATPIPPTATPSPIPTATSTPLPSPTPARTPRASATATPDPSAIPGIASVYWDGLAGNYFACSSYGTYNPSNPLIVAVSYERAAEWPCGTELQVCGVATGACLTVVRVDLCPGCLLNHIDLSAAGFQHVCANVTPCGVTIRRQ